MIRVRCRAVVLVGLVAIAPSLAHADTPDHRRKLHIAVDAGALGVFLVTETLLKDSLAPGTCRWCQPDSLDAHVRSSLVWGNPSRADTISNITGFLVPPLAAGALLFASSRDSNQTVDDLIPLLEAAVYTQLAVQVVKFSVGRQRPYAHFTPGSPSSEDNLSFPSGHTSFAFSIATAAGMVAHRRHYALEPAVWASGLAVAAFTGYLRIAADKHYLTDVLTGAALGTAGGIWIPQLAGSLPEGVAVVPTTNGVAVTGVF